MQEEKDHVKEKLVVLRGEHVALREKHTAKKTALRAKLTEA